LVPLSGNPPPQMMQVNRQCPACEEPLRPDDFDVSYFGCGHPYHRRCERQLCPNREQLLGAEGTRRCPMCLPSVGSLGHPKHCRPCVYCNRSRGHQNRSFADASRCPHGHACLHCHLDHQADYGCQESFVERDLSLSRQVVEITDVVTDEVSRAPLRHLEASTIHRVKRRGDDAYHYSCSREDYDFFTSHPGAPCAIAGTRAFRVSQRSEACTRIGLVVGDTSLVRDGGSGLLDGEEYQILVCHSGRQFARVGPGELRLDDSLAPSRDDRLWAKWSQQSQMPGVVVDTISVLSPTPTQEGLVHVIVSIVPRPQDGGASCTSWRVCIVVSAVLAVIACVVVWALFTKGWTVISRDQLPTSQNATCMEKFNARANSCGWYQWYIRAWQLRWQATCVDKLTGTIESGRRYHNCTSRPCAMRHARCALFNSLCQLGVLGTCDCLSHD